MGMKPKTNPSECVVCGKPFLKIDNSSSFHTRRTPVRSRRSVTCSKKCSKIRFYSFGKPNRFEKWRKIYEVEVYGQNV